MSTSKKKTEKSKQITLNEENRQKAEKIHLLYDMGNIPPDQNLKDLLNLRFCLDFNYIRENTLANHPGRRPGQQAEAKKTLMHTVKRLNEVCEEIIDIAGSYLEE